MLSREGKTKINNIFIHMLPKYGEPQDNQCKKYQDCGDS